MPTYVYECPACRTRFELVRAVAQIDDPVFCDICFEEYEPGVPHPIRCRRTITMPASHFPGAGVWRGGS